MADIFKLPSSSFEEIVKLIKAYSGEKEGVVLSLDDVCVPSSWTTLSAQKMHLKNADKKRCFQLKLVK